MKPKHWSEETVCPKGDPWCLFGYMHFWERLSQPCKSRLQNSLCIQHCSYSFTSPSLSLCAPKYLGLKPSAIMNSGLSVFYQAGGTFQISWSFLFIPVLEIGETFSYHDSGKADSVLVSLPLDCLQEILNILGLVTLPWLYVLLQVLKTGVTYKVSFYSNDTRNNRRVFSSLAIHLQLTNPYAS